MWEKDVIVNNFAEQTAQPTYEIHTLCEQLVNNSSVIYNKSLKISKLHQFTVREVKTILV
jgi:hypothetical protein